MERNERHRPLLAVGMLLTAGLLLTFSPASAARRGDLEPLRAKAAAAGEIAVLVELRVGAGKGLGALEAGGDHAGAARLRNRITRAQEGLVARLGPAVAVRHRFSTIPWVALRVDAATLDRLADDGAVGRVVEDRRARPTLLDSVPLIGASRLHSGGVNGSGVAVAVLDTGVDAGHSFFGGRVVREACFSANGDCPNGGSRQEGSGAAEPCLRAVDGCEHGTHVAGIAAGNQGVAPRASILAVNVFSYFSGEEDCGEEEEECTLSFTSDQIAGLEWVFSQRNAFRIAAVNMSLGGGQFFDERSCDLEDGATKAVIDNLRGVGIATVIASGNDGFDDSLGSPGCISSAVAVGSTTKSDDVSDFSNSAEFLELLAPGSSIQSSVPGGGFDFLSGTSMATPHVAGAWALLKQVEPGASVSEVLSALQQTGEPIFDFRNGLVHPRIQVDEAVEALGGGGGGNCSSNLQTLCLLQGRFQVKVSWSNPGNGSGGAGLAIPASDQTGFFYFTDPANIELIIKILDFGDVVKVFYGQLTNLPFTITVTDTRSGAAKTYRNTSGDCGGIDQNGFPGVQSQVVFEKSASEPLLAGNCRPSATGLCLLANRFRVEASWRNPYATSQSGVGTANTLSNLAGYFTYLDAGNVELLVKALDFGDRVLILYGAMSDFEYVLRVTDTITGQVRSYINPPRTYCGGIDNRAFSGSGPTPTGIGEVESNDSTRTAQVLSGAAPLVVSGNVETFDVGSVTFRYEDGTRDDIEDLYRINLRSGGLVATISGHVADLDLFLINSSGTGIIELSNKSGAATEAIELPDLGPGTYYLGVSIYDPSPVQQSSRYSLLVNGGL